MEFEDLDHGLALVEHEDKFFAILLRAHLVLDLVTWLEVEDSTFCSKFRNLNKASGDGERVVEDFAHVLDGAEFERDVELDWSRLLGPVARR